jgi:hypothetical protein
LITSVHLPKKGTPSLMSIIAICIENNIYKFNFGTN